MSDMCRLVGTRSEPKRGSVGFSMNQLLLFDTTRRYRVSVLTRSTDGRVSEIAISGLQLQLRLVSIHQLSRSNGSGRAYPLIARSPEPYREKLFADFL